MFNILTQVCNDYTIAKIISIGKNVVNTLRIISPILLVTGLSISFFKGIINPEDKKVMKKVGSSIAGVIIFFFLPMMINTIMETISATGGVGIRENGSNIAYNITACWNTNTSVQTYNSANSTERTSKTVKTEENSGRKSNSNSNSSSNRNSNSNKSNSSSNRNSSSNNSNNSSNKNSNSNNSNSSSNKNSNSNNSNSSNKSSNSNSSSKSSNKNSNSNSSSKSSSSNSNKSSTYNKVVLIGDSRFYGQSNYKFENSKTTYIAKSSEGLNFLKNSTSSIKAKDSSSTAFVINLGINDLYNVNNYISYINSLALSLKGDVYYLSVNPVDETKESYYGYSVKNSSINDFNSKMKKGLKNVKYLDSYSYLKNKGYNTVDGVHYDKDTYSKIYNFIASKVKS